jgi:hypothetical protein
MARVRLQSVVSTDRGEGTSVTVVLRSSNPATGYLEALVPLLEPHATMRVCGNGGPPSWRWTAVRLRIAC